MRAEQRKKYFSITFCWRLSVLGHGLGQICFGGWVGRVYVVESILDSLLKSIEEEIASLWMCLNSYEVIYPLSYYKLSAYFPRFWWGKKRELENKSDKETSTNETYILSAARAWKERENKHISKGEKDNFEEIKAIN